MADDGNTFGSCLDLARERARRTDDMIHSEIRALSAYWESLRAGRPVPYRAEVDPRDMRCSARNLFILEDLGGGNLRFRLAGTALIEAFGMELRGMSARSMMEGRARESFAALIEEALAEPGIGYARLSSTLSENEMWEVLLLPLRSDFGAIDRVLGGLVPVTGMAPRHRDDRLRFRIEEMSIRPVAETAPRAPRAEPVLGFAEDPQPFEGSQAAPASPLTAIDGGRADGPAAARPRRAVRPHLRIVKDD